MPNIVREIHKSDDLLTKTQNTLKFQRMIKFIISSVFQQYPTRILTFASLPEKHIKLKTHTVAIITAAETAHIAL